MIRYAALLYHFVLNRYRVYCSVFLLLADGKQQVEKDSADSCACNAGDTAGKSGERDVSAEIVLATESHYHDRGDNGNILGGEHIALLVDHDGDALSCDRAEQVYLKSADYCGRDTVDSCDKRSEAGNYHRYNGSRDKDGCREYFCDSHR